MVYKYALTVYHGTLACVELRRGNVQNGDPIPDAARSIPAHAFNQVCTKCQFLQFNYAMMCSAECQGHLRIRHQSAADSCQRQYGPQTGQVQALFAVTFSTLAVFAVFVFIEIVVTCHPLSLCVRSSHLTSPRALTRRSMRVEVVIKEPS